MAEEPASSHWGTITVAPVEKTSRITRRAIGAATLEVDRQEYEWRPPAEIGRDLPDNYRVSLSAMSCGGEGRRLYPEDPDEFVLNASLGGLAILTRVKSLDAEQRNTYNLMRLIVQYGPLIREALHRNFRRAVDLMVLGAPRRQLDCRHILPESLGCDASGNRKPWSIPALMEAGQEEAKARKLKNPSDADFIRLGLLAGARLNPVDVGRLTTDDAAGLLRLALFNLGSADVPVDEKTKEETVERFQESLRNHLEDSVEDFAEWFFQKRDGIVHQISKRKSGPGPIDRAVVREVLLELVFLALRYTGQCVHVQMLDFLRAIKPPLSAGDEAVFEVLYLGQPWLAGIPLAVLHRYFAPLREAIEDLWADPRNPEMAGVLLRLLEYHGEMVRKRRQADRTAKQAGPASARRKCKATASRSAPEGPEDALSLSELGSKLLRDFDVRCECGGALNFCGFDHASASEDTVLVDAVCNRCDTKQQRSVSYAQAHEVVHARDGESD
jgi:hypothetical protein